MSTEPDKQLSTVRIKPKCALPLWSRDPWVLEGAIARIDGFPRPGELVRVVDADGRAIGRGHYSPASRIAVRMVSWDEREVIDAALWRARIESALAFRHATLGLGSAGDTDAYRLLHAEGDGIPGLIADRMGGIVSLQAGTPAAIELLATATDAIARALPGIEFIHRHDRDALAREGVETATIPEISSDPGRTTIHEGGVPLVIEPARGQKTGFYTDQRENRIRIGKLARGRRVADLFSYTGGFAIHALAGGAREVVAIDSSASAVELAEASLAALVASDWGAQVSIGAMAPGKMQALKADAIEWALHSAQAGERYDLVIADPPKLVKSREHLARGLSRYRRIYGAALRLAAPRALVALFSCSGMVERAEQDAVIADTLREIGRTASTVARLGAGPDHPFRPRAGGGEYLKGHLLLMLD